MHFSVLAQQSQCDCPGVIVHYTVTVTVTDRSVTVPVRCRTCEFFVAKSDKTNPLHFKISKAYISVETGSLDAWLLCATFHICMAQLLSLTWKVFEIFVLNIFTLPTGDLAIWRSL